MVRNVVLNRRTKLGNFIIVSILLSVLMLVFPATSLVQAAPDDEVYNIAVLKVGGISGWGGWRHWTDDDFTQLKVDPGVESYTWNTVPTTDLTANGLANYDVLIVPHMHSYGWLDPAKKQAIVDWVNGGGRLIVHSYYDLWQPELINDPLMAAFGDDYRVDWVGLRWGWPSDNPWIG